MITTKKVPPCIEVTVTPDEEYEYIKCDSSVAGCFFLRHKDGLMNIWTFTNNEGVWGSDVFETRQIQPSETCKMSVVTEQIVVTLPSKGDYDASGNN